MPTIHSGDSQSFLEKLWNSFITAQGMPPVRKTGSREIYRFVDSDTHQAYYFKIFFRKSTLFRKSPALREYNHHNLLLSHNAPVASLIGLLKVNDGRFSPAEVIITEEIKNAQPLNDYLNGQSENSVIDTLSNLVSFLIHSYTQGFVHTDLHFGNIVINTVSGEFTFVDPGEIIRKRKVSCSLALKNAAQLYCAFYALKLHDRYWHVFSEKLNAELGGNETTRKKMDRFAHASFARWLNRRTRRCFKTNRDFIQYRTDGWRGVYQACLQTNRFYPAQVLEHEFNFSADYLKNSRSTAVIRTALHGNDQIIIKRFNVKRLFHPLKNIFRHSRAYRSWKWGWFLTLYGILVPEPLFFFERRRWGLLGESYYGMRYQSHSKNMMDFLLENSEFDKKRLISQFASFIKAVNNAPVHHHDLQLKNILVCESDDGFIFSLIDLEAVGSRRWLYRYKLKDHLKQLRKSYNNCIRHRNIFTRNDILYFLRLVFEEKLKKNKRFINKIMN
jgi:thiamine kinase-like enzyme